MKRTAYHWKCPHCLVGFSQYVSDINRENWPGPDCKILEHGAMLPADHDEACPIEPTTHLLASYGCYRFVYPSDKTLGEAEKDLPKYLNYMDGTGRVVNQAIRFVHCDCICHGGSYDSGLRACDHCENLTREEVTRYIDEFEKEYPGLLGKIGQMEGGRRANDYS